MKKLLIALVGLAMLITSCISTSDLKYDIAQKANNEKPRVIVTTDPEADDYNSMIRYLLYSTDFKTEGLICASSKYHWSGDDKDTLFFLEDRGYKDPVSSWRWPDRGMVHITDPLYAYEQSYENLIKHNPGYPTPEELYSKVRVGNIEFEGDITKDSAGSDLIKNVLLDNIPGPVYVLAWGGTNTIARALKSIDEEYSKSENWDEIYEKVSAKVIIQASGLQDNSYEDYIRKSWPEVELRSLGGMSWAFIADFILDEKTKEYIYPEWMTENILNVGPFGTIYRVWGDGKQLHGGDIRDFFGENNKSVQELKDMGYAMWMPMVLPPGSFYSEGDTPTFLNIIDNGLLGYEDPTFGGWGGRLLQNPDNKSRWDSGAVDVNPENSESNEYALWRWMEDAQHDFASRMQWTVTSEFEDANHPPVVSVNTDKYTTVEAGQVVTIKGKIVDPDNDTYTTKWWQYKEAGTADFNIQFNSTVTSETTFTVPSDAKAGSTFHIIFEVTDNGKPSLTRYQRIVYTVK